MQASVFSAHARVKKQRALAASASSLTDDRRAAGFEVKLTKEVCDAERRGAFERRSTLLGCGSEFGAQFDFHCRGERRGSHILKSNSTCITCEEKGEIPDHGPVH